MSPKFKFLVLIYENRTQEHLTEILLHKAVEIREKLIINIDTEIPLTEYIDIKNSTSVNRYFVISIIRLNFQKHIKRFIEFLPQTAHHLIIITTTNNMHPKFIHKLLFDISNFGNVYKMFTVTFLELISDTNLRLHSVLGVTDRHVSSFDPINYTNKMDELLNQLYFERFKNMESGIMFISSLMDFPKLFNAKCYNKDLQAFE